MTSLIVQMCDALADGARVLEGLDQIPDERVHRYQPFDPEALMADGFRHMAVAPVREEFDRFLEEESSFGTHLLEELYVMTVWEASGEGMRLIRDEIGWAALLEVHEGVVQWLYQSATQLIGPSALCWYAGTMFPETASQTRWFRVMIRTKQYRAFT